jgi:hypothetical protein
MTSNETRADRFARELADLKITDPAKGHPRLWQNVGLALMVAGIALGVAGYLISQRTGDALTSSTAINIALGGLILAVTGSAVFLRYSLTGFLRFWLARQSYELSQLAGRLLITGAAPCTEEAAGNAAANNVAADR